jgi:hypothetical protein
LTDAEAEAAVQRIAEINHRLGVTDPMPAPIPA